MKTSDRVGKPYLGVHQTGSRPASRARGQSDGGDHRQPERERRGKRGPSIDPHGYDGGKKIKGKKRHVLVDTLGLMLHAVVHSAGLQDRDGGVLVMATLFGMFPFLRKLYADAGYQGPKFQAALKRVLRQVQIEIVRRSDTAKGFEVLPGDGSSNAPSHGSTDAAASPRTGRTSAAPHSQSSASHPSAS
jgi:hypothetical protein